MNYSKEVISFVDNLIHHHAEFDVYAEGYDLPYNHISKFDLAELAAIIMQKDKDYAAECASLDNPLFLKKMLPTLIGVMKEDDPDNRHHLVDTWRDAILAYQESYVKQLLEDRLCYFNQNRTQSYDTHYTSMHL